MKLRCPQCKKGNLRQHVNVFVECSAGNRSLHKAGIRAKDVKIMGAGWDTAMWFCTNPRCGYIRRLDLRYSPKKRKRRQRECTCEKCQ